MKQILLLVVSFAVNLLAYANRDPVAKFSSINRVANPEPLSISEIRIVHEQINITQKPNTYNVSIRKEPA